MVSILPATGTILSLSEAYRPAVISGITIHPDNSLKFDFLIDTGDSGLQDEALTAEVQKMINYFLTTIAVPDDEMWVNLSPYEKDRIIAEGLGQTEMGRDMLIQDYFLKQLTASLMRPDGETGKAFWEKVYEAGDRAGVDMQDTVNAFNKVWIVPDSASVYVHDNNIFVAESHLKVMLEEDYLAAGRQQLTSDKSFSHVKESVRSIILPVIEDEVNHGKTFANLRQIYNSMLLATWYKRNLQQSLLGQTYMNQNKIEGIDLADKSLKEKIYNQYVESFKAGVYDYVKEEYDSQTQQLIPRKYFSGGLEGFKDFIQAMLVPKVNASISFRTEFQPMNASQAMLSRDFNYSAGNLQVNLSGFEKNYVKTSAGVVSVGSSMLLRALVGGQAEDFPSIFLTPSSESWQGEDGSNLMQVFFAITANWFFHGRPTRLVVKNQAEKQRLIKYLELGNPYYLPNLAGYDEELIKRFRREAIVLADRNGQAPLSIIRHELHMVEWVVMEDNQAEVEAVKIKYDQADGSYLIQEGLTFYWDGGMLKLPIRTYPCSLPSSSNHPKLSPRFLSFLLSGFNVQVYWLA